MQFNQVEASINFRTVKTKNEETGEVVETKRDSIVINLPIPNKKLFWR